MHGLVDSSGNRTPNMVAPDPQLVEDFGCPAPARWKLLHFPPPEAHRLTPGEQVAIGPVQERREVFGIHADDARIEKLGSAARARGLIHQDMWNAADLERADEEACDLAESARRAEVSDYVQA